MASSPLANFLSLFIPTKAPPPPTKSPPPPSHLCLSTESKDGLPPLVSSGLPSLHSTASSSKSDLMSVVCPSFAYANTLYFKSGYNVMVVCDEEESDESLVQRFRREVFRAGIIQETKRRRFRETSQEKKKRKAKEASKRNRRRRTPFRPPGSDQAEFSAPQEEELDEGGYDFPE